MKHAPSPELGRALARAIAIVTVAGCAAAPSSGVELEVTADPAPSYLRFDWLDGDRFLLHDVRVPEAGSLDPAAPPLAKIRIQTAAGATGARRAVVRGFAGTSVVSEGTAQIEVDDSGWAVVKVALAAGRRPDRDSDGVPDDVDGCPDDSRTFGPCEHHDGPAEDGARLDAAAPPDDAGTSVADTAPPAETHTSVDAAPDQSTGTDLVGDAHAEPGADVPLQPSTCGSVLLVVGAANNAGDKALAARLEQLGCAVTLAADSAVSAADGAGRSLAVISETVTPSRVAAKLVPITAGVIDMDPELLDDMAFTRNTQATDWDLGAMESTVTITAPTHTLAAKLSGTLPIFTSVAGVGWGAPDATAAIKVVSFPVQPTHYLVFGFEAGASMSSGTVAAGRRVAFLATRDAVAKFNADGWALFDAAVRWTSGH